METATEGPDLQALSVLIVDKSSARARELQEALQVEFQFEEIDFTNTPHRAIQNLMEEDYDLCLFADIFKEEDYQGFFRDLQAHGMLSKGTFVLVFEENEKLFDFEGPKSLGFQAAISRRATHEDREKLKELLIVDTPESRLRRKVMSVDKALTLALKEIDRAAETMKRTGSGHYKLNKLSRDFIDWQTSDDSRVSDEYFRSLTERTQVATPNNTIALQVPQKVLKKRFPGITEDSYVGSSHRVWKKLKNRYGVMSKPELSAEERLRQKLEQQGLEGGRFITSALDDESKK